MCYQTRNTPTIICFTDGTHYISPHKKTHCNMSKRTSNHLSPQTTTSPYIFIFFLKLKFTYFNLLHNKNTYFYNCFPTYKNINNQYIFQKKMHFLWIGTDRLLPLFRQFLLLPNRISLWISKHIVLPPALSSSAGIWSIPGDLWLFSLSIASSTSEALGSGTSGSAVCISACPTSLNPCTLNSWEK